MHQLNIQYTNDAIACGAKPDFTAARGGKPSVVGLTTGAAANAAAGIVAALDPAGTEIALKPPTPNRARRSSEPRPGYGFQYVNGRLIRSGS